MSASHTYHEAIENLYVDGQLTMTPKELVHTIVMEQDPLGRVATKLRDGEDLNNIYITVHARHEDDPSFTSNPILHPHLQVDFRAPVPDNHVHIYAVVALPSSSSGEMTMAQLRETLKEPIKKAIRKEDRSLLAGTFNKVRMVFTTPAALQ